MSDQLVVALLGGMFGAVVTGVGWAVNYHFDLRKEEHARGNEAALQYLTSQIQDFYGPLWGLIQVAQTIRSVAARRLPSKDGHIEIAQFREGDARIYDYFKEQFFLPYNRQIAELLRTHFHLLEGGRLPDSFRAFLEYQAMFETLHGLWRDRAVESFSAVRGSGWPMQFDADVESALNRLRQEYQTRLKQEIRRGGEVNRKDLN